MRAAHVEQGMDGFRAAGSEDVALDLEKPDVRVAPDKLRPAGGNKPLELGGRG
jgi:hypothetical protein